MEAEGVLKHGIEAQPVAACRFQQGVGADDIGLDEGCRAVDGAVDVGFGGQVHHGIRSMLAEHPFDFGAVADVDLLERVARAAARFG
ncbi:hypothetical protein D3C78_1381820 [compost metagenome]